MSNAIDAIHSALRAHVQRSAQKADVADMVIDAFETYDTTGEEAIYRANIRHDDSKVGFLLVHSNVEFQTLRVDVQDREYRLVDYIDCHYGQSIYEVGDGMSIAILRSRYRLLNQ